jgi:hypothetical protein
MGGQPFHDSYEAALHKLSALDLLIVDEFGLGELSRES